MEFLQDIMREGDSVESMHRAHLEDFEMAFENTSSEAVEEYARIVNTGLPAVRKELLAASQEALARKERPELRKVVTFLQKLGHYIALHKSLQSITKKYSIAASPLVDSSLAFTTREPGSRREQKIRAASPLEEQKRLATRIIHHLAEDLAADRGVLDKALKHVGEGILFSVLFVELLRARRLDPDEFRGWVERAKSASISRSGGLENKKSALPFRRLGLVPAGPWRENLDPVQQAARAKAGLLVLSRESPLCVRYEVAQLVDYDTAREFSESPGCGVSQKLVERARTVRYGKAERRTYKFSADHKPGGKRGIAVFEKCGKFCRPLKRGGPAEFDQTVAVSAPGPWLEYFTKNPKVVQRVSAYQSSLQNSLDMMKEFLDEDEVQRRSEELSQYSKLRTDLLSALRKYARGRSLDKLTHDENFLDIVPTVLLKTFESEYERGLRRSVQGEQLSFAEIVASFLSQMPTVQSQFSKELFDMHQAGKSTDQALEAAVDKIVKKNQNAFQSVYYQIELLRLASESGQKFEMAEGVEES